MINIDKLEKQVNVTTKILMYGFTISLILEVGIASCIIYAIHADVTKIVLEILAISMIISTLLTLNVWKQLMCHNVTDVLLDKFISSDESIRLKEAIHIFIQVTMNIPIHKKTINNKGGHHEDL